MRAKRLAALSQVKLARHWRFDGAKRMTAAVARTVRPPRPWRGTSGLAVFDSLDVA